MHGSQLSKKVESKDNKDIRTNTTKRLTIKSATKPNKMQSNKSN